MKAVLFPMNEEYLEPALIANAILATFPHADIDWKRGDALVEKKTPRVDCV